MSDLGKDGVGRRRRKALIGAGFLLLAVAAPLLRGSSLPIRALEPATSGVGAEVVTGPAADLPPETLAQLLPQASGAAPSTGAGPAAPELPAGWQGYLGARPATGRDFRYEGPDGITARVTSSVDVEMTLLAGRKQVWWTVQSLPGGAATTDLTLHDLHPGGLYYWSVGGGAAVAKVADVAGSLGGSVELSTPQFVQVTEYPPVTTAWGGGGIGDSGDGDADYTVYYVDSDLYFDAEGWGDQTNTVFIVTKSGITIDGGGNTIFGEAGYDGLTILGFNNVTVQNLKIVGFTKGILTSTADNLTLGDVTLQDNDYGLVDAYWTNGLTIDTCYFTSNGRGMHLGRTNNVTITGPEAGGCIFDLNLIGFEYYAPASPTFTMINSIFAGTGSPFTAAADTAPDYAGISIDVSNFSGLTVDDSLPIYYITGDAGTVYDSLNGVSNFVFFGGCESTTLENLDMLSGAGSMIAVDLCTDMTVNNCKLTDTFGGVIVTRSKGTVVKNCTITDYRWTGILVSGTGGGDTGGYIGLTPLGVAAPNTVTSVYPGVGIAVLNFSSGVAADVITIAYNAVGPVPQWGLYVNCSSGNYIHNNNIDSTFGTLLGGDSNGNLLNDNTFSYNDYYGLMITGGGATGDYAGGNQVYNNNFVGNATQAYDANANTWNDLCPDEGGMAGNHWSDWTGDDKKGGKLQDVDGADGIVDERPGYVIAGGSSIDEYPWLALDGWPGAGN